MKVVSIFSALLILAGAGGANASLSVIVNNTSDAVFSGFNSTDDSLGMDFTTGSSGTTLQAVILNLDFTSAASATATAYLFGTTAGGEPTGTGIELGTYTSTSSGSRNATFSTLATPALSANTEYSIVLFQPSSTIEWNGTETSGTAAGSSGTMGTDYYQNGTTWQGYYAGIYLQMELEGTAVPEPQMTGLCMGFGVLAFCCFGPIRRKLAQRLGH